MSQVLPTEPRWLDNVHSMGAYLWGFGVIAVGVTSAIGVEVLELVALGACAIGMVLLAARWLVRLGRTGGAPPPPTDADR